MAKKNKLLALVLAGTMIMVSSVTAFASVTIGLVTVDPVVEGNIVTVTVPYTATEDVKQVTLLVTNGSEILAADDSNISYIDQQDGTVGSFTFKVDKTVLAAAQTNELYIKMGGTGLTGAIAYGDAVTVDGPVPTQGPSINTTKTKVYSKTDALGFVGYRRIFVKLNSEAGQWIPTHSDANSVIAYSAEREGYDGLVKTTATTIEGIMSEITWAAGTPTVRINKYGDYNNSNSINIADTAQLKKMILKTVSLTPLHAMTFDTDVNSTLNIADTANIKKYILGTLAGGKFAIVNDN